ncbi:ABC transporter ATP-binding protein [Persephonella sp.]
MYKVYAIELYDVSKMYKLFKSKKAKILSLLGFPTKDYEEFWALKNITLKIKKGEKVGFIGRNGAGKTTLLSIIAGNIKPTSGKIIVRGKVNALFTLGTGFHPEFTGRDNIISSLAYQGITGREAYKLVDEIIEFTELEDFIDQPVKTYSAGMYSRLAFAVATAVKPEILIVDEILGVGDAYFNNKALERMNELTSGGTTVLFVSHDLSSIQKMCDRVIWIKKGKIQMDGEPLEVIKSYSFEVRKEEELRLKAKNLGVSKKSIYSDLTKEQIIIRFIGEENYLPEDGIAIDKIQLFYKDEMISEIDIGAPMDNDQNSDAYIIVDKEKMNWTESKKLDGRWVRYVKDIGGSYRHAVAIFNIPKGLEKEFLKLKIIYYSNGNQPILLQLFDNNEYKTLGKINQRNTGWLEKEFKLLTDEDKEEKEIINKKQEDIDIYGSGEVKITKFEILDEFEKEKYVFTIGDYLIFRIYFEKTKKDLKIVNPIFVIAIYELNGECISQIISAEKGVKINKLPSSGYVDIHIPYLRIGRGEYIISVGIFKHIDLLDPKEPSAFHIEDRKYRIKVEQPINININLGKIYHDAKFKLSWE